VPKGNPGTGTTSGDGSKGSPLVYSVVSGDTLTGIAEGAGVSLAALEAANPQIRDPNRIWPGDRVTIPLGGKSPVVATISVPAAVASGPTGPVVAGNATGADAELAAKGLVGTRNSADLHGSWAGWCLRMVNVAFQKAGHPLPELSTDCARDAYDTFAREGLVSHGDRIPVGAIIFWSWTGTIDGVTRDWGHVAISNGDGTCVSTLLTGVIDPGARISSFGTPLGWVMPPSSR
jgi:hypothetical protein